jgi:hypothetical protein
MRAVVLAALPLGAGLALAVACSSGSSNSVTARTDGAAPEGAASGDAAIDTGNPSMPDAASDSADGPIAMMDSPGGPGPYPAGPYGINVGDVLQNLSWDGYVNKTGAAVSTSLPYGPTTLQDLRGDGRGFALVHLSDFY